MWIGRVNFFPHRNVRPMLRACCIWASSANSVNNAARTCTLASVALVKGHSIGIELVHHGRFEHCAGICCISFIARVGGLVLRLPGEVL